MTVLNVFTAKLREKARLIRALLDENKANYEQVWSQISEQASTLPRDLMTIHMNTNTPWNSATGDHYENHRQLAFNMEAAADAYEKGDHDFAGYFESTS